MNSIFTYIGNMLLYIAVFLPIYILIRVIMVKSKMIKTTRKREIVYGIFVAYLIGFLSQTIIPLFLIYTRDGEVGITWFMSDRRYNLTPFKTIYEYIFTNNTNYSDWGKQAFFNVVGNLAMLIPFGFLVPIVFKKVNKLWKIVVIGITFITAIECIQYFIGRSADIDDLIVNVLGIIIGYLLVKKARRYDIFTDI